MMFIGIVISFATVKVNELGKMIVMSFSEVGVCQSTIMNESLEFYSNNKAINFRRAAVMSVFLFLLVPDKSIHLMWRFILSKMFQ